MNKQFIFFTGAPGSRWSGVSQMFRDHWPDVDNTDCNDPLKVYTHHQFSGHRGNYYGPNDLYGNWLDTGFGTKDQWLDEIDRSYTGEEPVKLILSHNFAYYLDDLVAAFPDSKVVMCYRPGQACFDWWHEAGGWTITYPDYTWYGNDEVMRREIFKQNRMMLEFGKVKGVEFKRPDVNFFRTHFDKDIDFVFDKDVDIAVYG